jgi:tetratricopeptide (TPR) repeat protein
MKLKAIYIYLGVFIIFVAAVIFFSKTTNDSNKAMEINPQAQMPDDDIHGKMKSQGNGDTPSKSNLMQDAVERINALKSEAEKSPNDTLKVREYADVLIAHKPEEAIKLYERILRIDSKRTDILLQLTFVYFNQGDMKKAEEFNSKVLTVDNNNLIAKFNIGGLAQAKGDERKAKSVWQDLANRYPQTEVGKLAAQLVQQLDQKPAQAK